LRHFPHNETSNESPEVSARSEGLDTISGMEYNTTMNTASTILNRLRRASGFTQRELARRAQMSNASLVAYAKGRQDPGLATLERLAEAAECDLIIEVRPRLSEPEIRTLELHRAIAAKLAANPTDVIASARRNLALMRGNDHEGRSSLYLDAWQALLDGPTHGLTRAMVSTDAAAKEIRQASPFSGILSDTERLDVLMCTDGSRVAAKSGRPIEQVQRELLDKIARASARLGDTEMVTA
jgi:transcriptional regulator with XRE-family HTH domain